jgi:hypothetical protein
MMVIRKLLSCYREKETEEAPEISREEASEISRECSTGRTEAVIQL